MGRQCILSAKAGGKEEDTQRVTYVAHLLGTHSAEHMFLGATYTLFCMAIFGRALTHLHPQEQNKYNFADSYST